MVLVYVTDTEANILRLAPEAQRPLDDAGNKLDFKYDLKTWGINDSKIKGLKQFTRKFPPVNCDYEVWIEKVGMSERVKFSPTSPPAYWMTKGPAFQERVLAEAAKLYDMGSVARTIGRDLSVKDIDELCGLAVAKPKAAPAERNFAGLLG